MNYPGNETLAEEIRERILNTFRQTLELVEKGDRREARLGCDFILRLDPLFEPARTLHQRLQAESESIEVNDLKESLGEVVAEGPDAEAAAFFQELDAESSELDSALDLSSLQEAPAQPAPGPPQQPDSPTETAEATAEPNGEADAEPDAGADTELVATLDSESEQRVQDLLTEGQAAFDKTEYQSAIDSWSRIFLIDIDHPEASRRIDLARKLKSEVERKLEETFHDALTKVESGRLDEARSGFEAVLQMMPGHLAAQEYLDRLDTPDLVAPEPAPVAEPREETEKILDAPRANEDGFSSDLEDVLDEPLHPPVSTGPQPRQSIGGVGKATTHQSSSNRTFRIVGAAVLVVLAVVGWLLYENWDNFFPNASDTTVPVRLDPITRAQRTYDEAGAAIAIAQLRRLSPGHPQYAEAQALVAKWEALLNASRPEEEVPEPESLAARDQLVEEARAAFQGRNFLLAQELLERGAAQSALEDDAKEMLEQAKDNLAPIQSEIAMFRDGEWEMSLRNLWRMWESGSTNPDIRRLMVDSYFNLGVRNLQRNDAASAISNFKEAQELSADDAELSRLIEFAETYQGRPEDLLYRIFVKYVPFR